MIRILGLFVMGTALLVSGCKEPLARSGPVVATGTAQIGGDYQLVDQSGQLVTQDNYLGRPQLIYFGFSFCPDVCPLALQKMGTVQASVDPKGDKVNFLFISVDPERDTAESLAQYVTANGFPKGLTGLTGTQAQIDHVKSVYKVYSVKVPTPESAAPYTVDHSDIIYLMGSDGEFLEVFTGSTPILDISKRVKRAIKRGE